MENTSKLAYLHCKNIEDDPEIRKKIKNSYWAYRYCEDIKSDPEVAKYINLPYPFVWFKHKYKEMLSLVNLKNTNH